MQIRELLVNAQQQGVLLYVVDGKLKFVATRTELNPQLKAELTSHKQALIEHLSAAGIYSVELAECFATAQDGSQLQELSYAQQRMWFLNQLIGPNAVYNIPLQMRFGAALDVPALLAAVQQILQRHQVLRSRFISAQGQTWQQLHDGPPLSIVAEPCATEQALIAACLAEQQWPFDLSADPLVRLKLFRLDTSAEYLLSVVFHHSVADGWSTAVFWRELQALYQSFSRGEDIELPALPLQYADFAHWQRRQMKGPELQRQLSYWRRQLDGLPPLLELPLDRPRPAEQSYQGQSLAFRLEPALAAQLQAFSLSQGVTLFMTLLSAFSVVLRRYSGQTDLAIGSPLANRTLQDTEQLIGFFVNTLVWRFQTATDPDFSGYLQQVRQLVLDGYDHQDVPFELLVQELSPERSQHHSPLFQVMFTLQNMPDTELSAQRSALAELRLPDLVAPDDQALAHFDLTLGLWPDGDTLAGEFEFNSDLFDRRTIARLCAHFTGMLTRLVEPATLQLPLSRLLPLTDTEHQQMQLWNQSQTDYPQTRTLASQFSAVVAQYPDKIALREVDAVWTYQQLNQQANQLAHHLITRGVGPDRPVGLLMDRSAMLVIAIVAVIKAGGYYIPLDPETPVQRLQQLINDSGLQLLLHQGPRQPELNADVAVVCCRLEDLLSIAHTSQADPAVIGNAMQLAYANYTSGSTGQPKGVLITQQNVSSLFAASSVIQVGPADVMAQVSNHCFDAITYELWGALLNGAELVVLEKAVVLDPAALADNIRRYQISTMFLTTALFNRIALTRPDCFAPLRQLLFGGEAYQADAIRRLLSQPDAPELIHVYGPTECTTFTTAMLLDPASFLRTQKAPIGGSLSNRTLYVLSADGQVPVGVVGELYIGGDSLARGYQQQPALTAEYFVPDPFSDRPGQRLYRTGDLVRQLPDGALEFVGRIDHQVKINGFRIETDEIVAVLRRHPAVTDAFVRVLPHGQTRQLAAYLVVDTSAFSPEQATDTGQQRAAIMAFARQQLPQYMLPKAYNLLGVLPLNDNGKVDHRQLPEPDWEGSGGVYAAPVTETECLLHQIWSELLHAAQLGIDDNFFSRGGDSILSIQLVSRARACGLQFSVKQLFANQTIRLLAGVARPISVQQQRADSHGEQPLLPIQHWFFAHTREQHDHFHQSQLFHLPAAVDLAFLQAFMRQLVTRHEVFRLCFEVGSMQQWQASYTDISESALATLICEVNLADYPAALAAQCIAEVGQAVKAEFRLQQLPLLRAVWFRGNQASDSRLLLVVHHLVMDGVSWRILHKELLQAYQQWLQHGVLSSSPRTSSYQQWGQWLQQQAGNMRFLQEKDFWIRQLQPVPADQHFITPDTGDTYALAGQHQVEWSAASTELLLTSANVPYRTKVPELLVAALMLAMYQWRGLTALRLGLEGHGRVDSDNDFDFTETIGWFTAVYPLLLQLPIGHEPPLVAEVIKAVKEQMRQVPQQGLSYGVLTRLARDPELLAAAQAQPCAVVFNYLGQFDQHSATDFAPASEAHGADIGEMHQRAYSLGFNGAVKAGRLTFNIDFDRRQHSDVQIAKLAQLFRQSLQDIIGHNQQPGVACPTVSDFPLLQGIRQPQLEEWLVQYPLLQDLYPTTDVQRGFIYHSLLDDAGGAYATQLYLDFQGRFEPTLFRQAWDQLCSRHDIFRTAIVGLDQAESVQLVQSKVPDCWTELDWRGLNTAAQQFAFTEYRQQDKQRGFDVDKPPLMRMTLLRLGDDHYRWLWTHHHCLLDGWSVPVIFHELFSIYQALQQHLPWQLSEPVPYHRFIGWLASQDRQAASQYWQQALAGFDRNASLVPARSLQSESNGSALWQELQLDMAQSAQLEMRARTAGVPLNTLFQAAWALLLCRYTGQSQAIFGQTISGRPADIDGIERMVGLCINTVPVQVRLRADQPLTSFLQQLHQQQVERENMGYLPLADIQRLHGLAAGEPLFDTLLVVQNYPVEQLVSRLGHQSETGLPFAVSEIGSDVGTHYGLTLVVAPGAHIHVRLEYQPELFSAVDAAQLLQGLQHIFCMLADPLTQCAAGIRLQDQVQLEQKYQQLNKTDAAAIGQGQVHRLFEQQVALTPANIAVSCQGQRLSYAALNAQANQLAHWLRQQGLRMEQPVAICMEPSVQLLVALLAVLKAGACYLPLDPAGPAARQARVLADSGAALLLTQSRLLPQFPAVPYLVLDDAAMPWQHCSSDNLTVQEVPHVPDQLAYLIYTSGSTGQPKGVMVSQHNLINYCQYAQQYLTPELSGAVASSSLAFDATVCALFPPLLDGKTVELVPQDETMLDLLADIIVDSSEAWLFKLTPAHLQALLQTGLLIGPLQSRHVFVIGGAQLTSDVLQQWQMLLPEAVFINEYGPTETTVGCSVRYVTSADDEVFLLPDVAIGQPVANTVLYVLDTDLQLQPTGVAGELYIGGSGVSRGYLGQPGLTASRFVPDPFSGRSGARLYRSGDRVRLLPNGDLQYLQRLDDQLKIRGRRIEPAEIEMQLRELSQVQDVVVGAAPSSAEDISLFAWLVPAQWPVDAAEWLPTLRQQLSQRLPLYMVPDTIVLLEQMPLTVNGKIDRAALLQLTGAVPTDQPRELPATTAEQQMLILWQDILKRPAISVTDDFFALGGHSIAAMRLISAIRQKFAVELPLRALFDRPTIRQLCAQLQHSAVDADLAPALPEIRSASRQQRLPLSYAQQRLWFIDQLGQGSHQYNMQGAYLQHGRYQPDAFAAALQQLMQRHEVLRTCFAQQDGQPYQVILPQFSLPLRDIDLSALPTEEQTSAVLALFSQEGKTIFQLQCEPLVRVLVLQLSAASQLVMFTLHHIACDGWSMLKFQHELQHCYAAAMQQRQTALSALPLQYADYAVWQRQWMQGDLVRSQLLYWQKQLTGLPKLHSLPLDYPRPAQQSFAGKVHLQQLPDLLLTELQALAEQQGVTLFILLETAFALLLSRYSTEKDIVVGSAVAGRTHSELEDLIGFFINSVVLRTDLSGDPTFSELLQRNKQVILDAYANQYVPFDMLVEELRPERDLSYNPLFQIMFAVETHEQPAMELLPVPPEEQKLLQLLERSYANDSTSRSDLQVQVNVHGTHGSISWIYNESLFVLGSIDQLSQSYLQLLQTLVQQRQKRTEPEARVSELACVSLQQQQYLRTLGTGADLVLPQLCLHQQFELQVRRTPQQIAVQVRQEQLSYLALNCRANQLAHYLIRLGVRPGVIVGLCMESSAEMLIGIMAILKAGGAYLPLDPALPMARLAYMLEQCQTPLVLTQQDLTDELDFEHCKVLALDSDLAGMLLRQQPDQDPQSPVQPSDPAYLIFTSGSTGKPKGVQVSHRAAMMYCAGAAQAYFDPTVLSGSLVVTSYSVDMTVPSLYLPLFAGATVQLPGGAASLDWLAQHLQQTSHSYLLRMTPSHVTGFTALMATDRSLPHAHTFVIGGEALHRATVAKLQALFPAARIMNHYGPSEAVVGCVINTQLSAEQGQGSVAIGQPMAGKVLYVLDEQLQLQLPGSIGQLAVAGAGLADGYLHDPALNAQKFVQLPLHSVLAPDEIHDRVYLTGDLVRWQANGQLSFIGRQDDQVKVRGHRVELGDIDARLKALAQIRDAKAVVIDKVGGTEQLLVAYVVSRTEICGDEDLEIYQQKSRLIKQCREQLARDLPGHMVPSVFVFLPQLPMTPNGKVDKAALPMPQDTDLQSEIYVEPDTDMEAALCLLWQDILQLDQVGVHDNFFALGGHSLLATRLMSALRQDFVLDIPVRMLFEFPTIREFAPVIEAQLTNQKQQAPGSMEEFII